MMVYCLSKMQGTNPGWKYPMSVQDTQMPILLHVDTVNSNSRLPVSYPSGSGCTPVPSKSLVQDPGQETQQDGKSPGLRFAGAGCHMWACFILLQRCTHQGPEVPKRYGGISRPFAYVFLMDPITSLFVFGFRGAR